jgi:glycosyltransferase involved in cell wall biosynthesis/protein-tyrosine-phosphatase
MTEIATPSTGAPQGVLTLSRRARRVASACRALVTARARLRRRSRPSETLRVLYLLETGGPGGAERMLLDLAENVGPGWQAVVGVMKAGWLRSHATSAGLPCVMVGGNGLGDLGVLQRLVETVETHEIDVIHAHEFYMSMIGALVSVVTGIPLVVTIHGKSYYPDRRRRRAACRMVAAGAAAVVAVSQDLRSFFCRTTGTSLDRVRVIYNGIDLRGSTYSLRNVELLDSAGIPREAQIVGTVGNLYPVKGHLDLIRAVRTIVMQRPTTHVVILGRGALHDALTAEADALGIRDRIHLLGYREDVKEWLGAMDVFTMPSLSEGLPLSLLEAMAAGVPPVVTEVGGMPEVVRDRETGFIVPPGNVEALANRISFLLGNPSLAAGMGAASRDRILNRFTLDRMVAEYRNVYRHAVESSVTERLWQKVTRRLARANQRRRMLHVARHPNELAARLARARTILFVCYGNIIRSAFAAELLRAHSRGRPDLQIRSAGLHAAPDGPAHPTAVQCARRFGVDLNGHRTRRLDRSDIDEADLLLAMEIAHVVEINRLFPQHRHKVYLFGCLTIEDPLDIADPVHGTKNVFESCFERIDRGVQRIAELLPAASRVQRA